MPYEPSVRLEIKVFDVEITREGSPLLGRIYQPQGPGPFAMLLDEHGGAWSNGNRTTDEWMDRPLAESGLLILSPEFRIGPKDPYPAQLQDINLATRWFKAHARELNGDVMTLGGIGFSSGGHTVVLSAMRPRHPLYSALPLAGAEHEDASLRYAVSCWPVIDPLARYERARAKGNQELVETHDHFFLGIDAQIDANPVRILERKEKAELPPVLLCHGTADDNVPYQWVTRFAQLYLEAGGNADVEGFEGAPHGFGRRPEYKDRLFAVTRAFIERRLGAKVAVYAWMPGRCYPLAPDPDAQQRNARDCDD